MIYMFCTKHAREYTRNWLEYSEINFLWSVYCRCGMMERLKLTWTYKMAKKKGCPQLNIVSKSYSFLWV